MLDIVPFKAKLLAPKTKLLPLLVVNEFSTVKSELRLTAPVPLNVRLAIPATFEGC